MRTDMNVMRLCSTPGCGRKIESTAQLCDECRANRPSRSADGIKENRPVGAAPSSYRDGVKLSGAERAAEDAVLKEYGSWRWKKLRPLALQKFPFCDALNCCKPSRIVDHIIPARLVIAAAQAERLFPFNPMEAFYIMENLHGLCDEHHNQKHREDKGKDWTVEIEKLLQRFRKKATG